MDISTLVQHLRWQAGWCEHLGSPLNSRLLEAAARDLETGGPVAALLDGWTQDPSAAALALRIVGALHALALDGRAPTLACAYGQPFQPAPIDDLRAGIREALTAHPAWIRDFISRPVQTNELARSACLLGGFLEIAQTTGLPLRLIEIGSSGGLNLLWDKFHYTMSGLTWGDPASPVHLSINWRGPPARLDAPVSVTSRRGCDINPIDMTRPEDVARAEAYIWPGQTERLERFRAGAALARAEGLTIEKADAADWLRAVLAEPAPGACTVVFHSIMWHYMPIDTQKVCRRIIESAGGRASETAPLAWLRMEAFRPDTVPEIHLTQWPGNTDRRLAVCHPHGVDIEWMPGPVA